jgi:hypothetical protein
MIEESSQSKVTLRGFLFSRHQCADRRTANSRIIANTIAGFARAEECAHWADWRARELSADRFKAEYHHADDSRLPHRAHDQMD